jgi:hypothetical protein
VSSSWSMSTWKRAWLSAEGRVNCCRVRCDWQCLAYVPPVRAVRHESCLTTVITIRKGVARCRTYDWRTS